MRGPGRRNGGSKAENAKAGSWGGLGEKRNRAGKSKVNVRLTTRGRKNRPFRFWEWAVGHGRRTRGKPAWRYCGTSRGRLSPSRPSRLRGAGG